MVCIFLITRFELTCVDDEGSILMHLQRFFWITERAPVMVSYRINTDRKEERNKNTK
jgi:hypothetical protein